MSCLMHFRESSILVLTNEFVLKGGSVKVHKCPLGMFVFVSLLLVLSPLPVIFLGCSPLSADWLTKLSIIVRRLDVNLSASS